MPRYGKQKWINAMLISKSDAKFLRSLGRLKTLARFDAGGARVLSIFFRASSILVAFLCGLGGFWTGVWIFAVLYFALLIAGRSFIAAYPDGVYVRNLIAERWYPWIAIDRFEALSIVQIVGVDGDVFNCWAVQRANISAALGRVSRVDHAVTILEALKAENPPQEGSDGTVVRAVAWLRLWDLLQVLLVPVAGLFGFWVMA